MPDELSDQKRFESLSSKLLDNAIEPLELRELIELIRTNPELTELLCNDLQLDSYLAQYDNLERSAEAFIVGLEGALAAESDGDDFVARVLQSADEGPVIPTTESRMPVVLAFLAVAACVGRSGSASIVKDGKTVWQKQSLSGPAINEFTRFAFKKLRTELGRSRAIA